MRNNLEEYESFWVFWAIDTMIETVHPEFIRFLTVFVFAQRDWNLIHGMSLKLN